MIVQISVVRVGPHTFKYTDTAVGNDHLKLSQNPAVTHDSSLRRLRVQARVVMKFPKRSCESLTDISIETSLRRRIDKPTHKRSPQAALYV